MSDVFFSQKRIFLTGGTGFFGKSILDMINKGYLSETFFTILSRDPNLFLAQYPEFSKIKKVNFVKGDVRNFTFPQGKFDIVFHGATPAVTTLAPGEMRSIILEGTQHILSFARKCGAERMLFVSSGAVYGPTPPECECLSENQPCAPVTEYGIAKLEAENLCFSSGVDTVAARCFAFLGPRLELGIHFAAGNFLKNCLDGESVVIKGDGTPLRSYLYADDLVEWLFAIIAKGKSGCVYNVGSPHGVSIRQLAEEMVRHFTPRVQVKVMRSPIPGAVPERYVPDVSKIQEELGVKVKILLPEAIERSKAFHLISEKKHNSAM